MLAIVFADNIPFFCHVIFLNKKYTVIGILVFWMNRLIGNSCNMLLFAYLGGFSYIRPQSRKRL